MFCDPLDIPDDLVSAQEQGKLVVFAGAGVSMGPPSNLPGFEQLAERIAKNSGKLPAKPFDKFLGDLEGIKVHQLCRDIINDPASQPTPLHTLLLQIFRKPEYVRIVTTNFDSHFTTATKQLGWPLAEYKAPALPLGHDFTGIVHLHGSVQDEPKRLVLTDADFGRAYLTEGWASTFLRGLFAEFTVLFIGYGHDDPPMQYFARGLGERTAQKRYALTSENDITKWRPLGIVPISYALAQGANSIKHEQLTKGVTRWHEISTLSPTSF